MDSSTVSLPLHTKVTAPWPSSTPTITTSRSATNVLSKSAAPGTVKLTQRERLVLAQVIEGLSSKEIARAFELSPRTIEFHRANILRKWAARNTAHLALKVLGD
jgi:DNA-binding NarL/FixJ family response regulator